MLGEIFPVAKMACFQKPLPALLRPKQYQFNVFLEVNSFKLVEFPPCPDELKGISYSQSDEQNVSCNLIWIQCWPGFGHSVRRGTSQGPSSLKDSVALGRAVPVQGDGAACAVCIRTTSVAFLGAGKMIQENCLNGRKKRIFCIMDAFWVPRSLFCFIWW